MEQEALIQIGAKPQRAGDDEELSRLAKALAHPVRVQIVRHLQGQPCVCGDLVAALPLAQSTVSQHLKVLKEAGVVVGEIDGPSRCYCVNPVALERLARLVDEL